MLAENAVSRWVCRQQDDDAVLRMVSVLKRIPGCETMDGKTLELTARLLFNRGIRTAADAERFFSSSVSGLHDPMLLPDMDKATARIKRAVLQREKVTVYGDYDVDGITSTAIMYDWLRKNGCDADYYIPDRTEEGYGLNNAALENIRNSGTTLVVTVDTGTTAVAEARYAAAIGLDVVVTDHHECKWDIESAQQDMPGCCAVVNPKRPDNRYPFGDLAGVGVVFKLICALQDDTAGVFDEYGALVALGSIADIMPLMDENRDIVRLGLEKMKRNTSVGISALLAAAKSADRQINSSTVAYQIAPRLNAAGRIGDPSVSVRLLLSKDPAEAASLAEQLCEENRRRQLKEQEIFSDVVQMISRKAELPKVIIAHSPGWHNGVIGIVASRVTEKYRRPCILFCDDGDSLKGSARSVPGVSIYSLILSAAPVLQKFGGHEMAAGLTLKKSDYNEFTDIISASAKQTVTEDKLVHTVTAECMLDGDMLDMKCCDAIQLLEPCGAANPVPVFETDGLFVSEIDTVGSGRHLRVRFSDPHGRREDTYAVWFNHTAEAVSCFAGHYADIMFTVGENFFNGKRRVNICIKDMRPAAREREERAAQTRLYEDYINGIDSVRLTRSHVAAVYRYVRRLCQMQTAEFSIFTLAHRVFDRDVRTGYAEARLCLDVLSQIGLLKYRGNDVCTVEFAPEYKKADLNDSALWRRMNGEQGDK